MRAICCRSRPYAPLTTNLPNRLVPGGNYGSAAAQGTDRVTEYALQLRLKVGPVFTVVRIVREIDLKFQLIMRLHRHH